jgi:hypothetical protein
MRAILGHSGNKVFSGGTEWEYQPDQACWTNAAGESSNSRPPQDKAIPALVPYIISFPEWPESKAQRVNAANPEHAAAEATKQWEADSICYHVAEGVPMIAKVGSLYFQVTGEMVPTYKAQITEWTPDLPQEEEETEPPGPYKIGLCCNCGGTFDESKTIIEGGREICRECPQLIEGRSKPVATSLAVYFNGADWVVAESAEEAEQLCCDYYELPVAESSGPMLLQPSDKTLDIHQGDPDDLSGYRKQTMAQWAAKKGRGFLATTEF